MGKGKIREVETRDVCKAGWERERLERKRERKRERLEMTEGSESGKGKEGG